ncbi:MAG TPA: DUF4276 family protein [Stellaceae bacterium]|nr:DUF4276 family protein [Stellaceae bacterium]
MSVQHFEILVEEPSMEAFLTELLPRLVHRKATYTIHPHQGKPDLLRKLAGRLRAYSRWLPPTYRIVVIVDLDDEQCAALKGRLEAHAAAAGLHTRKMVGAIGWQVVNRIAIEELEAWFFGDWQAVRLAYPNVAKDVPGKAQYRNCDAIAGGTWEAFERVLRRAGYFSGGYRKVEAAREIGRYFEVARCSSLSFRTLHTALVEALECGVADGAP